MNIAGIIFVQCKNCAGASTALNGYNFGKDEATSKTIEAWNRRVNYGTDGNE